VLLGRHINKILKQVDWKPRSNGQNIRINISEQQNNSKNTRTNEKSNQFKGVLCHECEGYGHIKTECATFLKRQKKSLAASWSDEDDSEGEVEKESAKHVNALTSICMSDTKSCDEELTYEELAESYKDLYTRSEEICRLLEKQKKYISQLNPKRSDHLTKISELNDEVNQLSSQLSSMMDYLN